MSAVNSAQLSSLATRRTWREDALVIAALLVVLILGFTVFAPAPKPGSNQTVPAEGIVSVEQPTDPHATVPGVSTNDPSTETPAADHPPAPRIDHPISPNSLIQTSPAFITLFGTSRPERLWHVANHDTKGGFWRNDFKDDHVETGIDGMVLKITEAPDRPKRPWNSGEIGTHRKYGYGRYEIVMSPAKGTGLISSFFIFTAEYFGDPHDEIDIEFLGKDTSRVELNMFTNGEAQGSKIVDLPFDAADALHLYAIEWFPDEIIWYADNVMIHRVTSDEFELPSHPGKIMMNLWTGNMVSWHGKADFKSGSSAVYACVSYQPFGGLSRTCSDFYQPQLNYRHNMAPS